MLPNPPSLTVELTYIHTLLLAVHLIVPVYSTPVPSNLVGMHFFYFTLHLLSRAAIVSDLVRINRILNLENCDRTDFFHQRLSSDFARARVYYVILYFDLSHAVSYS